MIAQGSDMIFQVSVFWVFEQSFVLILAGLDVVAIAALLIVLGKCPVIFRPLLPAIRVGQKYFFLFWAIAALILTGSIWWHCFSAALTLDQALASGKTNVVVGRVHIERRLVRGRENVVVQIGSHEFPMNSALPQPGLNDPNVLREGTVVMVDYFELGGHEQIVRVQAHEL